MDIIPFSEKYKDELIQFINTVYHEYGDQVYLKGFDQDLLNIPKFYSENFGYFWLLTDAKNVLKGSIAIRPGLYPKSLEIKRFYLHPELRGKHFAQVLFNTVVEFAKEQNCNHMYLWTDARFIRAQYFYRKRGFTYSTSRKMYDGAMPYEEFLFEKQHPF